MSEELYNSSDYCSLAEQYEELKKENAELTADKIHLIQAAMDGGDRYHYTAHDIGYRDLERKVKALEADYSISNRELLILSVELARLAELEAERRWIPVSERLPEIGFTGLCQVAGNGYVIARYAPYDSEGGWTSDEIGYCFVTHWMPLPPPPELPRDE